MPLRFQLQRVPFAGIGQPGKFRVAEQGVVLEVELGVQRQNIPVFRHNERIDFRQGSVLFRIQAEQILQQAGAGVQVSARESQKGRGPPRLEVRQAVQRISHDTDETLRRVCGHGFNIHASVRAGHQDRAARRAIQRDRRVQLARDLLPAFHQHRAHHAAFRPVCPVISARPSREAAIRSASSGVDAGFTPSGPAPASGVDLRLDHHVRAQLAGRRGRFGSMLRHRPSGTGMPYDRNSSLA